MRITRTLTIDGATTAVEVELTPAELAAAHREQEHLYDVQNVRNHISSGIYDDDDNEIIFTDDEIEDIAYEARHDINKHDVSFECAVDEAIGEILRHR